MNTVHEAMLDAAMQIDADLGDPSRYIVCVLVFEREQPGSDHANGHVLTNLDIPSLIRLLRHEADKLEARNVGGHA